MTNLTAKDGVNQTDIPSTTTAAPRQLNQQLHQILDTTSQADFTRKDIGPLTTLFLPDDECRSCHVYSVKRYVLGCSDYIPTSCDGYYPEGCLPDSTTPATGSLDVGFYSPGRMCPGYWTEVGAFTQARDSTDPFFGIPLRNYETGVVCCPE